MESVTYVCYSKDDLAAQVKTLLTEIRNVKQALLKVAENDTNAGTLEEIKALLGMNTEEPSTTAPQATEPASEPSTTSDSDTDIKSEEKDATEPSDAPTTATESHTVTVQPGDTLQTLAEKTGTNPRHLIDLNMLMEPVVLRPGQTLNY